MIDLKIFKGLKEGLRKEPFVGLFVLSIMGYPIMWSWAMFNQKLSNDCNESYRNYAKELEKRTLDKYEADRKYYDSIQNSTKIELEQAKKSKEELEKKLFEIIKHR